MRASQSGRQPLAGDNLARRIGLCALAAPAAYNIQLFEKSIRGYFMKRLKMMLSATLLTASMTTATESAATEKEMTVYRSPTCGCCGKWIEHAKQNHFVIKDIVSDDMQAIKQKLGVPEKLASCHTVIVDGYVIEGHVPAADIEKLLQTKPEVVGIAAPGMPMGSPGMEMGGRQDDYDVISFDKAGNAQVFSAHKADN